MIRLTEKAINDPKKEVKSAHNGCRDIIVGIEKSTPVIFEDQGAVAIIRLHGQTLTSRTCRNS